MAAPHPLALLGIADRRCGLTIRPCTCLAPAMQPLLALRFYGDPMLRLRAHPVQPESTDLRGLVESMFVAMRAADGIGLAANQVGRRERLCVLEVDGRLFIDHLGTHGRRTLLREWARTPHGRRGSVPRMHHV